MRSCSHSNYAFLTLSLLAHKRHLMDDSKIILKKTARLLQIAEKENQISFDVEVDEFWN